MELLGSLGIDIKLLIAQVINFGLLLWLLSKFLYKPIIERIEKDEKELEQAKFQSKELEQAKVAFENYKEKEMTVAKQKVEEIIHEAENIAKEIQERTYKEAEGEKRAVIQQIKSRLSEVTNDKNTQ